MNALPRRTALKMLLTAAGSTAASALLAACGETAAPTPTTAATAAPRATATTGVSGGATTPATTGTVATTAASVPATIATGGKTIPELKVGVAILFYRSLDPHVASSNIGDRLFSMIYDTLIRRDFRNNSQLVPGLATEWRRTDDRTLELTLRRGVRWQDGTPFTASDVKYTFDRLITPNPKLEISGPSNFPFSSVEAVDDYRVRITSTNADPLMEKRLATTFASIIPAVYHRQAGDAFGTKPIGTGPYKVVEFVEDSRIVFEAHDNGFDGPPAARKVTMRVIPEVAARIAAIGNGEIDLATNVPPDQIMPLQRNANLVVKTVPLANIFMFRMNQQVKPVDKKEVRQAINHAIDRKTIIETMWGGNAVHTRGFQYEGEEYYNPNRPLTPYDPDRAKRLLEQGGYAGEQISYLIDSPNYYTNEKENAEALIGMFRAVGMPLRIEGAESSQTVELFKSNKFQMMATSSSSGFGDPDGYLYRTWGPESAFQKNGWWPMESAAKYNQLVTQARTALDRNRRYDLYQQALDEFDAQQPLGIFYTAKEAYAMKRTINWTPYPLYWMDLRPYNFTVI